MRDPPGWVQEPRRWLGGTVGTRVVLATTPTAAVLAHDFAAYPEGVSFVVDLRPRERFTRRDDEVDFDLVLHARYSDDGELSPSFFRFGVQLADGTKLTNLDTRERGALDWDEPPDHPVLRHRGGGGSGQEYALRFWLWPLPAGETISLVCEWPVVGIPESRTTIETAAIHAAAARARPYWRGDE